MYCVTVVLLLELACAANVLDDVLSGFTVSPFAATTDSFVTGSLMANPPRLKPGGYRARGTEEPFEDVTTGSDCITIAPGAGGPPLICVVFVLAGGYLTMFEWTKLVMFELVAAAM